MKTIIIIFLIALLSGMGVGGGGLLVIYLTLFENVEQVIAQGTNLSFFIATALASTVYNVKKKKIVWKITLVLSISGAVFSLLGSFLVEAIDRDILRKLFGGMLALGGISSLISSFVKKKQNKSI